MQRVQLGARGPEVSRLCFGTLTMGPLQRNLPPEVGGALIAYAAAQGIDFLDTAEIYGTYPHIAVALKQYPKLRICTKCYAATAEEAAASLEKAQQALGREYIDIFLLHEQESEQTLRGHEQALRFFAEQKRQGIIGAIGISTHHVAAVQAAVDFGKAFGGLDIIHPIFNRDGLGIVDGTREEMEEACLRAKQAGIGIFAMKPLGGGHLIETPLTSMAYTLTHPAVDAVAVGMQSQAEIDFQVAVCAGEAPELSVRKACKAAPRRAMVHDWCTRCGACVRRCSQGAVSLGERQAEIDPARCVRCGYCAAVCPEFCIKVI